jgi:hypothetical protein
MGRSITPTFRVEYHDNPFAKVDLNVRHSFSWNTKAYGRPTNANLEKWRTAMNKSYAAGGVNEHVSEMLGYAVSISAAQIVRQASGEVVATYTAPMFEVA